MVHSNMLDDSMYYGRGAGRKATASAVVGDAMACAASIGENIENGLSEEAGDLADIGTYAQRYFLRLKGSKSVRKAEVENILGKGRIVFDIEKDEFGFLMDNAMEETQFMAKLEQLQGVIGYIRVL
jgi:homoserine dehydrogenase